MALTLLQIVKGEKSFKGKSIAEIAYTFWIFHIFLSLKDRGWIMSAEMFNRGVMEVFFSIVLSDYKCIHVTGDSPPQRVSWVKTQYMCDWGPPSRSEISEILHLLFETFPYYWCLNTNSAPVRTLQYCYTKMSLLKSFLPDFH